MIVLQWLRTWRKAINDLPARLSLRLTQGWTSGWRAATGGIIVAIVSLFFSLVMVMSSQAQSETPSADHLIWQLPGDRAAYQAVPFAPGELLVGFHGETGLRSAATLLSTFSAEAVERLDLHGLDGATGDAGIAGYRFAVPPGQEWTMMEQLLQDPNVAFVTPNWLVFAATPALAETTDEATATAIAQPEQPFVINDPKYEESQWYLQRINASRAWSLAYSADGFAGVLDTVQVAVIDSGIDGNDPPEFHGRLLAGVNYFTAAVPGCPKSFAPQPVDDYGHGTHVAGLIGAVANNASGIAGVAPKVRIDARKVLNCQGSGTISNVSKAIREAADNGADIINLSLESGASNPTMEAAVQYAHSKGILLIAAAGNGSTAINTVPVSWPAAYAEVMAVAATNYNDKRASYSNVGPEIDLAAPGGEGSQRALSILSTWPGGVKCRDSSTVPPQSDYCTNVGTSMAAALVSGAAAFIKSVQPGYTAEQIRQLLRETTAPPTEGATFVGSGRLDIQRALRTALAGRIELSTNNFINRTPTGAAPYVVTLRLDNPSLQPVAWRATLLNSHEWVRINDTTPTTNTTVLSGTVVYGEPRYVSFTITPTYLTFGSYVATVRVDQLQSDNSFVSTFVNINLLIDANRANTFFMPIVVEGKLTSPIVTETFQWETPVQTEDRRSYTIPSEGQPISLAEVFTFTLRNNSYDALIISSEGFVSFPDTKLSASVPNHCMPNLTEPAQAIYGWWADLDPDRSGARVSTFQPGSDRFVIEFENVPAAGATPAYQVSFQIVLYRNGDVRLNYLDVPVAQAAMPTVTIGIEGRDGLFYNQVVCSDGITQVGYLPSSHQTLYFDAQEDLY